MGEKLTQTMALEVWTLNTPADMCEAFQELVDHGYRGEVKAYPVADLTAWFLEVNIPDKPSVTAVIGQTVVLFGGVLEAMTAEAFEARFG